MDRQTQHSGEQQETVGETKKRSFLAPLTNITPTSKVLSAVLFVVLPFVGFWLGLEWGKSNRAEKQGEMATLVPASRIDVGQYEEVFSNPAYTDLITSLPTDPGEVGKATIEGFDSDRDGVRDDVQRWIVLSYPESEQRRAVLMSYAAATQRLLTDYVLFVDNPDEQKQVTRTNGALLGQLWSCGFAVFGGESLEKAFVHGDSRTGLILLEEYTSVVNQLQAQLLNTTDRQLLYANADILLAGESTEVLKDPRTACDTVSLAPYGSAAVDELDENEFRQTSAAGGASADYTDEWQTFENKELGFRMRYPSGYRVVIGFC